MEEIVFRPIGVIRSPFLDVDGMPVQPMGAKGVKGRVELNEYLQPGLKDLEGFSHIVLIYYFHQSKGCSLHVLPFLDKTLRGVFATRVPRRPNGIGMSVVRLTGISGSILDIEEVDILDGTPLLDIKPFVPQFDNREVQSAGWFTRRADSATVVRADRRFVRAPEGGVDSRECGEVPAGSESASCEQSSSPPVGRCVPNLSEEGEGKGDSRLWVAQRGRGLLD